MRSLYTLIFALFCLSLSAQSPVIYGIYTDQNAPYSGYSILAEVEPVSGEVMERDTIWGYDAVALGTSNSSWLTRDVFGNETLALAPVEGTLNGVEFDIATSQDFGIGFEITDSTSFDGQFYEYEYTSTFIAMDYTTGETELIAMRPEIESVFLGATTFDPINGIYYLIGYDQQFTQRLMGLDRETGDIVVSMDLGLASDEYINDLRYDIGGEMFYALHRNGSDTHLARITPNDGTVTDILDITGEVPAFSPGASVYVFFSLSILTSISENEQLAISVGPNPTRGLVSYNILDVNGQVDYALIDAIGRLIDQAVVNSQGRLDLSQFSAGSYFLLFTTDENESASYRLILE